MDSSTLGQHFFDSVSYVALAYKFTEDEKIKLLNCKVAKLIALSPYLMGCDDADRQSVICLSNYVLGTKVKEISQLKSGEEIGARISYVLPTGTGNVAIMYKIHKMLTMISLNDFNADKEDDSKNNKYNPLDTSVYSINYDTTKSSLLSSVNSIASTDVDSVMTVEEASTESLGIINYIIMIKKSLPNKVSITATLFGLFMVLINLYNCIFVLNYSFIKLCSENQIYITLILTIVTFITCFLSDKIEIILHLIFLFFCFSLAVITNYISIYGIGLFILFMLLFDSYGYLDSNRWSLRVKVLFIYYFALTILSVILNFNHLDIYRILINTGFTVFMLCIIYSVTNIKHFEK